MKRIKFDCHVTDSPGYGCSSPGDQSGDYYRAEDVDELLTLLHRIAYVEKHGVQGVRARVSDNSLIDLAREMADRARDNGYPFHVEALQDFIEQAQALQGGRADDETAAALEALCQQIHTPEIAQAMTKLLPFVIATYGDGYDAGAADTRVVCQQQITAAASYGPDGDTDDMISVSAALNACVEGGQQ